MTYEYYNFTKLHLIKFKYKKKILIDRFGQTRILYVKTPCPEMFGADDCWHCDIVTAAVGKFVLIFSECIFDRKLCVIL